MCFVNKTQSSDVPFNNAQPRNFVLASFAQHVGSKEWNFIMFPVTSFLFKIERNPKNSYINKTYLNISNGYFWAGQISFNGSEPFVSFTNHKINRQDAAETLCLLGQIDKKQVRREQGRQWLSEKPKTNTIVSDSDSEVNDQSTNFGSLWDHAKVLIVITNVIFSEIQYFDSYKPIQGV